MSKEKQTEEQGDKVVTRYDRRVEKRKKEEEKERRSWLRFRIISIVILAAIAVAIIFSLATSFYSRYQVLNQTYFKVGGHDVTRLEYNYYFSNSYNNYLGMYGSYASIMGLDTTMPLDGQTYPGNENMTWKDYFDQAAVTQLQQVKAMVDEAKESGFEYDSSEDLAAYESEMAAQAESAAVTENDYYTMLYGEYATKSRVEPIIEENMLANAYYNHLVEENQPPAEEIASYYEENKDIYDTVTYRSFYFEVEDEDASEETAAEETSAAKETAATEETAAEGSASEETEAAEEESGMTEEEIAAAMDELKVRADEMAARLDAGEDFEDLCVEYANEAQQDTYGGEEEGSLTEEGSYYGAPTAIADWLFDEARQEGEIAVLESESLNRYYVVQFLSRQNDEEATNESIGYLLSSEIVNEHVTEISAACTVTDVAGELHYLTVPEETVTETEAGTDAAETESAEAETAAAETESAEAETAAVETETAETENAAAETETAETGTAAEAAE